MTGSDVRGLDQLQSSGTSHQNLPGLWAVFARPGALFALALLWPTSQAHAACNPTAGPGTPATGTTVSCTGTTNAQNAPNGYGDGSQTGITIDVVSGASVSGGGGATGVSGVNGGNGGDGGNGIFAGDNNTINNFGTISGGGGGAGFGPGLGMGPTPGGNGGNGLSGINLGNNAVITTTGSVAGGAGGTGGDAETGGGAGDGGVGIFSLGNSNLTASGTITGGDGGTGGVKAGSAGTGGDAVSLGNNAVVNSSATITGGAGGDGGPAPNPGGPSGGSGGVGLNLGSQAVVISSGAVTGGAGGKGSADANGGKGGAGISAGNVVAITASGTIMGGAGGGAGGGNFGGTGGRGGDGIDLSANAVVDSSATITGGAGNGGGGGTFGNGNGGTGGAGLVFTAGGGTFTNSGSVTGGSGGHAGGGAHGGAGGVGIQGTGLTVIDAGTISGGLAGDGVTVADAILFTGGTNTLQLQLGYNIIGNVVGTGTDTFQLGGSGGNATFNLGSIGPSQQYQGFSNFNVVGATWTVTGTYGQTDPWTVQAGTLNVTGDLSAATSLTVTGGTLMGTGTVGNTQINGGTFAPGNGTPGSSMTVSSLSFAPGATYEVQINPATASFANVTGTASLNGTVDAVFAPGSYVGKQYIILQSTGLSGTFSGLSTTDLPADFTDSLSYNGDDVFLNLTAALGFGTPLNVNQQNVATAINNFFNSGGTLPPGFVNVFNFSGADLTNALTQLDGENATGAEHSAFQLMNEFLTLMLDPYVNGRSGGGAGGPLGFAPDQEASLPPDIALAYAGILKAPPKQTFAQRWSAWGAGFGGSATTNGDPTVGSNDVTTSTFGYAAGMDYHYSPDTVLGFALAGGGTNWNLAQGLGTGRSDAFLAGIYGVTHQGPVYLAGTLAFANNWFTTNRLALGDTLTASFQGQSYAGRLEGGYRFVLPVTRNAIGITPYAAIQAQNFHTPAYSETDLTAGGFGLSYAAMNGTDTRSELGGRFDDPTLLGNMPLILRAKVAWAHDWVSNPALNASFESLPGASFTVFGAPMPQNSALTGAGAELFFTPNWSLLAKFDGEFAKGSQLYAGTGTLRYTW